MNIANALYQFTENLVVASSGALSTAGLHLDVHEKFEGDSKKWVRFSGMRGGSPMLRNNQIERDNAVHYIYFVAQPVTPKVTDRFDARELSERMADEWMIAVYDDRTLGGRVCGIGDLFQLDEWIQPVTLKMPVTVVQIKVNPR